MAVLFVGQCDAVGKPARTACIWRLPPRHRGMASRSTSGDGSLLRAVLGPTNTGKTHLAVERLCAHSSGAIGFPLRLLAREVYDRVVAIKGADRVALITGEERIEPKNARWLLCTAEAMPVGADLAFIGLDEAQIGADRERGHIFTDRLLHARGREETMILGSVTLKPMIEALLPEAEIVGRPRFSTLSHAGARKLSRLPPRSAIVAFSAEQVYAIAEMLRRFRGGSAVVMGALSPQTRNAQVAMFQAGEVDYLVATDAIGMGLNLDLDHVAFAGLSKFDGVRQRRLAITEMAQIAGRAGRHQRDGSFGTLAGTGSHDAAFTDEEVFAIEEHRFAPLTHLNWREAEPRFTDLATLIADLEAPPDHKALRAAPEAIDLAVLKRLASDPAIAATVKGKAAVARFWEACCLPDFRQLGGDQHALFVARLWDDLGRGQGYIASDFVARKIAELDVTGGDIDQLGGRISAIRSWAYITQRPDWVQAKDEMAARARAVEARLSDALHARLTERFVNRRNIVLMRKTGADAGLLPVALNAADEVIVDGEAIGQLHGFRFSVDPDLRHDERKLLLAAAERHLPGLLDARAAALLANLDAVTLGDAQTICWQDDVIARIAAGGPLLRPRITADKALHALPPSRRDALMAALGGWLEARLASDLGSLLALDIASRDEASGSGLRALLIQLVAAGAVMPRHRAEPLLAALDPPQRHQLRRLGVRAGRLDLYHPAMLKPRAAGLWGRLTGRPEPTSMPAVIPAAKTTPPFGYRRAGPQWLRVDLAQRLIEHLEKARNGKKRFIIDPALAISMGLTTSAFAALLRDAGYRAHPPRHLAEGMAGPQAPLVWSRAYAKPNPARAENQSQTRPASRDGAFSALADLLLPSH